MILTDKSARGWCDALWQCLGTNTREDGSKYVSLSDSNCWSDIRDDLQTICREAHNGEMPNDWRFDTIYSIVDELQTNGWDDDTSHELADSLTDVYTSDLLTWVAGNITRATWSDDDLATPTTDIVKLIQVRQYDEIRLMVRVIIQELERLAD